MTELKGSKTEKNFEKAARKLSPPWYSIKEDAVVFLPKEKEGFSEINVSYKKAALLFDELDVYLVELDHGYQVVLMKDDEVYTIVEYK